MALSAIAQIDLHIDNSLESKLDRLLAQKVKPQAMFKKPTTMISRKVLQKRIKIKSSATNSQNL